MAEFGTVTQVGKKHILGVIHVPIPRGRGPQRLQHFWDPELRPNEGESVVAVAQKAKQEE